MPNKINAIGQLFVLAFEDSVRMLRFQWRLLLALLVAAVVMLLAIGLSATLVQTRLGRTVVLILLQCAYLWATAPYFVALCRYIATGEAVPPESIRNSKSVAHFFAWASIMAFALAIPSTSYLLLSDPGPVYYQGERPPVNQLRLWATGATLAVGILGVRVMPLLPAAALGREASIHRAFAETRGNFWFIVGATALPVVLITGISTLLGKIVAGQSPWISALVALVVALLYALTGMSLTVRLYVMLNKPGEDAVASN